MNRNILITGGTGFIGSRLIERWLEQGHNITVLSRRPLAAAKRWRPAVRAVASLDELDGVAFDTLINLAGEGIADARWSDARKQALRDSRIRLTEGLVHWSVRTGQKYRVVLSGSAVGYYGAFDGDQSSALTEDAPAGRDFAAQLCEDWEQAAQGFSLISERLIHLRTGLVLGHGGMLERMRLPFALGLGGRLGDGQQMMSWIHREDYCNAVDFLLNSDLSGAVNMTAPGPVTNAEFTRSFASAMHRPALLPAPAMVLKLLLGEMSDLLLKGQTVVPGVLQREGFEFAYPSLPDALTELVTAR